MFSCAASFINRFPLYPRDHISEVADTFTRPHSHDSPRCAWQMMLLGPLRLILSVCFSLPSIRNTREWDLLLSRSSKKAAKILGQKKSVTGFCKVATDVSRVYIAWITNRNNFRTLSTYWEGGYCYAPSFFTSLPALASHSVMLQRWFKVVIRRTRNELIISVQ